MTGFVYEHIDLTTEQWTHDLLMFGRIYTKKALVQAELVQQSRELSTVLADGTVETTRTVHAGDILVTNPGGEQYAMPAAKFASRYEPTATLGTYRATGQVRALSNPLGRPIEIVAPWGETQRGAAICLIATTYDPTKPDEVGSDRYLIGYSEFKETYEFQAVAA